MSKDLQLFDALKADITLFVAPVKQVRVTNFKSSEDAVEVTKRIKSYLKELDKKRRELVDPLNAQVKLINNYVKQIEAPLEEADRFVKSELNRFAAENEKRQQEERRKFEEAQAESERKAQAERARVEAEIEAKRQAELQAIEEHSGLHEEAASLFGAVESQVDMEEERARIEHEAEIRRAEEQARLEREDAERRAQFSGQAWDLNQKRIKNTRTHWQFEVINAALVPREFLMVNEAALRAYVKATKGEALIPGVRVWSEQRVAIGQSTYVPELALAEDEG